MGALEKSGGRLPILLKWSLCLLLLAPVLAYVLLRNGGQVLANAKPLRYSAESGHY